MIMIKPLCLDEGAAGEILREAVFLYTGSAFNS